MQYPLPEIIGNPDLLVGREKEFGLLDKWISRIPDRLSKSRAILARRKSGKTAIVQRIFNRLWSENGEVIPFYINIPERNVWFPNFAVGYYCAFASQYISFLERDQTPVDSPLTMEQIREYGKSKSLRQVVIDVDSMLHYKKNRDHDLLWQTASSAPKRYARLYDQRFLVIMDEFQNTGEYVHTDENHQYKDKTIPGTWHDLSESKLAPLLVTGSYVGWLINIIDTYLEAGRLKRMFLNPYLLPEDGLQTVYKYAEFYREPITNESALQINRLCMSDPFFISCVVQSDYEGRDLTTEDGVIETVHHEITFRKSEMQMTWGEYIDLSLKRINTVNAKHILLHLSKHSEREWTPGELRGELGLEIGEKDIRELLKTMVSADLICEGSSDIDYRGLTDGTLCLILRHRFEKEIATYQPNLEKTDMRRSFQEELRKLRDEKESLRGMISHLTGKMAEYQLATEFRSRKRFSPSRYFANVADDTRLNVTDVRMRVRFQRPDGKNMEMDVLAESDCGRVLATEVKKTKSPVSHTLTEDFMEKLAVYAAQHPDKQMIPAFFSTGGFTGKARKFCEENGIATAREISVI
ncbi:hypothetical protein QUF72_13350 [Desulfobacterales bacterium HSG2]|nr:hypothetical protein [Desulfobacterales bacterium HSG2]